MKLAILPLDEILPEPEDPLRTSLRWLNLANVYGREEEGFEAMGTLLEMRTGGISAGRRELYRRERWQRRWCMIMGQTTIWLLVLSTRWVIRDENNTVCFVYIAFLNMLATRLCYLSIYCSSGLFSYTYVGSFQVPPSILSLWVGSGFTGSVFSGL